MPTDPTDQARPVQRRSRPGALTVPKRTGCPGCGTYTDGAGAYCVVCAQRPVGQAPKATRETAPQPQPVYEREGRFPGTPRA